MLHYYIYIFVYMRHFYVIIEYEENLSKITYRRCREVGELFTYLEKYSRK